VPTIVPDAAYALAWLWILNPVYGPLNLLLGLLGSPQPAWLVDPTATRVGVVLMAAFQIGEGFVVLLAALKGIPGDLYDAAAVDGSTSSQTFRYLTLPLIAPWLVLLTLRDVVLSAQTTFAPAYLVTGGDPYYSTTFLPLLIFQTAFDRGRFGEAAAMTVLLLLVVGAALVALARLLRGWGYADEL
jgi:multiple sugar transport system permease protein